MRHVVLDTETTGLDPRDGHRLVEIGCIELFNLVPTGRVFHSYINPERDMPYEAFQIHGLSIDFLKGHPPFEKVVQEFLAFIEADPLVIHNARFDLKFLNHELQLCNLENIPFERAIDTVYLAKQKFPGSPVNLDALCKRFTIDNSGRTKHGALLDAELLAEVYLQLMGGRQQGLGLHRQGQGKEDTDAVQPIPRKKRLERPPTQASIEEQALHEEFLKKLNNPLWATNL